MMTLEKHPASPLVAAFVAALACTSPIAGASAATVAPGAEKTLVGKLEYRKLPQGKSDAAYHGVTFFLTLDDGTEEKLFATTAVSANALYAFHGKRAEVRATWIPPRAPNPAESAPVDPFGNVIPRAGRWAVQEVKAAASPVKTLVGTLEYRELPEGKSVEAYHGVTFFLTLDDGTVENLSATKAVSANALSAFHGKRAEVRVTRVEPRAPEPFESAPMDPFGNVMPRAGRWAVQEVRAP